MTFSEKILQRVYTAAVSAAATLVTKNLLTAGWKLATGNKPPGPGDPDATLAVILSWTAASSVGLATAQLLTRRYTLRHLKRAAGKTLD